VPRLFKQITIFFCWDREMNYGNLHVFGFVKCRDLLVPLFVFEARERCAIDNTKCTLSV
jgi:hypothetical protein